MPAELQETLRKAFIYNNDEKATTFRVIAGITGSVHIATAIVMAILGTNSLSIIHANLFIGGAFIWGAATGAAVPMLIATLADVGWYFATNGFPLINLHFVYHFR